MMGEKNTIGQSQGKCETTLTERFSYPPCHCGTYEGNLGPCKTYEQGASGQCVYCEHDLACHLGLMERNDD
jgi:hypothetical protein